MAPSPLLTPFTLGGDLPLKNRMVLAPMTRGRAGDSRCPDAMTARYYVQRASAGLLITEGIFISPVAIGWAGAPEIYSPAATAGWKEVTDKVHAAGGLIFCQLWHSGRASHSSFHPKEGRAVAPSAIAIGEPTIHTPDGKVPHEVPDALTVDGIKATVADFAAAAANAKAAGFDGCEIHGANGYLIDSFLQTKTNKRTDEYTGESLEGRFRFLKEIVEAVLEVWPANRVGVRLSPNGVYNDQVRWEWERGGHLFLREGFGRRALGRGAWPAGGRSAAWPVAARTSFVLSVGAGRCLGVWMRASHLAVGPSPLSPFLCSYQLYSYASLFVAVSLRMLPIDARLLVLQGSPDFREAFPWFVKQLDAYKLAYIHFIVRSLSCCFRVWRGGQRGGVDGVAVARRADAGMPVAGALGGLWRCRQVSLPQTAPPPHARDSISHGTRFFRAHLPCLFLRLNPLFSLFLVCSQPRARACSSPPHPPPPPLAPPPTLRRLVWALASTSWASRW